MASKIFLELPGGVKMPAFGLGTFLAKDPAELELALDTALEAGYRHIDTAYLYENEQIIGKVLKKWFSSGKLRREEIFITTKLPHMGVHPDRVEYFMKKSLENLQVEYVDLYLIHSAIGFVYDETTGQVKRNENNEMVPLEKTDHVGVWKKMEEQVVAGRAKTIGISNFNSSQIEKILKCAKIKPANLQVELHVYFQQRPLVDFCTKNGITVVAYSPLGSPGYNKFLKSAGRPEQPLPDILGDPVINKIAKKYSKTPAQVVLRYLLQQGIAVIPKSVTPKRIQENFNVFDFSLDNNDVEELKKLDLGTKGRIFNATWMPTIRNHPDYPFKDELF